MLFFKRILNFDKADVAQRERRQVLRYKVEPTTPLVAALQFHGFDELVTLLNLSSGGAGVQVDRPLGFKPGDPFHLRVELGRHRLRLDGTVAHRLAETNRTQLGLKFEFANFEEQKTYLQMLEPVAIGASLKPVKSAVVHVKEGGLVSSQYQGPNDTLLTVWRKFTSQDLQGFEFRLAGYCVRNGSTPKVLEISAGEVQKEDHHWSPGAPALNRAHGQAAEIRQLFLWIVPQMNSKVPDDVRAYLSEFRK